MKEAFLAALLSVGLGPDKEIELMEIVKPVKAESGEVAVITKFVPAIIADDTKADRPPHVVRYLSAERS